MFGQLITSPFQNISKSNEEAIFVEQQLFFALNDDETNKNQNTTTNLKATRQTQNGNK